MWTKVGIMGSPGPSSEESPARIWEDIASATWWRRGRGVAQSCLSFVNNFVGPTETLLDRTAVVDRRWDRGRKGPTVEVTVTEETDMFLCLIFFFCVYFEKYVLICIFIYVFDFMLDRSCVAIFFLLTYDKSLVR